MNQNSSKKSAVNRRNILIFRFVALPLCFLGLTALSVMCFLKPPSTVPTSNLAGEKDTQSVLSNFSDDLGAATEPVKFSYRNQNKSGSRQRQFDFGEPENNTTPSPKQIR